MHEHQLALLCILKGIRRCLRLPFGLHCAREHRRSLLSAGDPREEESEKALESGPPALQRRAAAEQGVVVEQCQERKRPTCER